MKSLRLLLSALLLVLLMILAACRPAAQPTPSQTSPPATTPPVVTSPPASPPVTPPPTSPTPTPTPTPPTNIVRPTTPDIPDITPPPALIGSRARLNAADYVVFAWNDLGMHCLNPTYDTAVLLPPYNTVWAQVIKRGNPPQVVTSGISVEYSILNNTSSYEKGAFGQFWDNVKKLFGVELEKDTGLNLKDPNIHNGLSGNMVVKGDHFEVDGIPLTPVNDSGTWNPFQVGEIVVKDSSGNVLAETSTTVPTSDEINCSKCHGADAFNDILQKHDRDNGTDLVSQKPVLCAGCHGSPALGKMEAGPFHYLSERIHGFHASVSPTPACYDCHPGTYTDCSRSLAHTAADGNCTTCHGGLAEVSMSIEQGRVPWLDEPKCSDCHTGVAEVDTGTILYRNATGHGDVYCAACHSSPHAMVPSNLLSDNYQALQYQGEALSIGACEVCHNTSRGGGDEGENEGIGEFAEKHGGSNPDIATACSICHTSVPTNTGNWPHAFQWKTRN